MSICAFWDGFTPNLAKTLIICPALNGQGLVSIIIELYAPSESLLSDLTFRAFTFKKDTGAPSARWLKLKKHKLNFKKEKNVTSVLWVWICDN
jgi:hypothetical protein